MAALDLHHNAGLLAVAGPGGRGIKKHWCALSVWRCREGGEDLELAGSWGGRAKACSTTKAVTVKIIWRWWPALEKTENKARRGGPM